MRPVLVALEAITERLVSADVHCDFLDERGNSAQQEGYCHDYRYVLQMDEEAAPRIQVVIVMSARLVALAGHDTNEVVLFVERLQLTHRVRYT